MLVSSCYKEAIILPDEIGQSSYIISFNKKEVAFDLENETALFQVTDFEHSITTELSISKASNLSINGQQIKTGDFFEFMPRNQISDYTIRFTDEKGTMHDCKLFFTLLPIVQLYCSNEIPDEPKTQAIFKLTDDSKTLTSFCGIEIRGAHATRYEKKSYGIELVIDSDCVEQNDIKVLGMRKDDDWILDAMYIDRARMRNKLSFYIWESIIKTAGSEHKYQQSYIESHYTEVFINNRYIGLYNLSERLDAKQLGIELNQMDGYLYKSEDWTIPTVFKGVSDTIGKFGFWDGWEQKHPKPEIFSTWKELYNFIDFVANASNEDFRNNIFNRIDQNNLIDYLILLNLTKGLDNQGKNIFLAKNYPTSTFYICPWDLDATWGRGYSGDKDNALHFLSFNLYDRIIELNPDNFKESLLARWNSLCMSVINPEYIQLVTQKYVNTLVESGAISREYLTWGESTEEIQTEVDYIRQWATERIEYLDDYFQNL